MDVGFAAGGKEEEPVLLDLGSGVCWVPGQLGQRGIGLERPE